LILAWNLPCYLSYDFFKAELLKTKYFDDNIFCHFAASFGAVRTCAISSSYLHVTFFCGAGYRGNDCMLACGRVEGQVHHEFFCPALSEFY
jgi:hypothetical protein